MAVLAPMNEDVEMLIAAAGLSSIVVEDDLVRNDELGEQADFAAQRLLFQQAVQLGKLTENLGPFDQLLPDDLLMERHKDTLYELHRNLLRVNRYASGNPNRDDIINGLVGPFNNARNTYLDLASWQQAIRDADPITLEEERESHFTTWLRDLEEMTVGPVASIRANETLASESLDAIRQASGNVGAGRHSVDFAKQAKSHNTRSVVWLLLSLVLVAATLGTAVALVYWLPSGGNKVDDPDVLAILGLKALAVATGFFLVRLAVQLFRTERHLAVVSEQKALGWDTFQTFVHGAVAPEIRDAVLLESTRAIFAPTSTGLVGEAARPPSGMNVLEVIRQSERTSQG